jgi:enoyl-CoA hydratase/carnithine racemase
MEGPSVLTTLDGSVSTITINREERRNAFDFDTLRLLFAAFTDASRRGDAAILLTGAGTAAFSAGGDIKAYAASTPAQRLAQTDLAQQLLAAMREHPAPIIAAVEGYCVGGGLELALGCDLRIAGSGARFGFPEVSMSALPSVAGYRLAHYIGIGRATEVVVFGRQINAAEARSWGLVSEIVPHGSALARAYDFATTFANSRDRATVARAKALIQFGWGAPDRTGRYLSYLQDEVQTSSGAFNSGVTDFTTSQ